MVHSGVCRLGILFGTVVMLLSASQAQAKAPSQVRQQAIQSQHYQVSGQVQQIASPQDYADAAGAISFNATQDVQGLTDVSYFVVGQPAHFSIKMPASNEVVRAVEVAVNPEAHTQLITVGVLGKVPPSSSFKGFFSQPPIQADQAHLPASCTNISGWDKATWKDPFQADVNWVENWANWCYDGQAIDSYNAGSNQWYLNETGWYQVFGGFNKFVASGNIWGEANTVDRFVNPNFLHACPETDTYYTPWTLVFWNDGSIAWDGSTYDSGTCSSLLHWVLDLGF